MHSDLELTRRTGTYCSFLVQYNSGFRHHQVKTDLCYCLYTGVNKNSRLYMQNIFRTRNTVRRCTLTNSFLCSNLTMYASLLLTDDTSSCRSLDEGWCCRHSKRSVRSRANLFPVVHGNKQGTASGFSCLCIEGTPKTPDPPIFCKHGVRFRSAI